MTPSRRYDAFLRWRRDRGLTEPQAHRLLVGLAHVGIYLRVEEDGGAYLRMMGGAFGEETLRGFMVVHGLGPVPGERE